MKLWRKAIGLNIKGGRGGPIISHLMFADDLLLFGKTTRRQMQCVESVINKFCQQSGKKVSIAKIRMLLYKNTPLVIKRELHSIKNLD